MSHANVAQVFGIDQVGNTCFMAMEFVPGEDLAVRLSRGTLPLDAALDVCGQIAAAVQAAHEAGVIHRDLKPGNVIVAPDGRVKVLDFGLAKPTAGAASESALTTDAGRLLGTPAYMAPEQARGEAIDERADVWAFGCVLYECLTGRRAFEGSTVADVLAAVLRGEWDRGALPSATPEPVRTLLERCLAPAPGERLASLRDVSAVLEAPRAGSRVGALVGTAVVVVGALGVWFGLGRGDESGAAIFHGPSVAVLPFENRTGDEEHDLFCEGLTDELITQLSRFSGLSVISRRQTRPYGGDDRDLREVSTELGGVRYFVEGTVRKGGEGFKVDASLTDAEHARVIWSNSYAASMTAQDLFAAQEDLTLRVVNELAVGQGELSRAELARSAPEDLDSYLCVLRTYRYWNEHTEENHRIARDCVEDVVEQDREYAEAWAMLAYLYSEEYHHRFNERPELYDAIEKALEFADTAIRLDGNSQVAHGAKALIYRLTGDRDLFLIEAKKTVELSPGNADWLSVIGMSYAQLGYFEEGKDLVARALALHPRPATWLYMVFFLDAYHHERYEEALEEALRTDTQDFRNAVIRGATYAQVGELEKARREVASLRADPLTDTFEEVRETLIWRMGYAVEIADHLLDGLRKAGFD
jgi:TolB-like protein